MTLLTDILGLQGKRHQVFVSYHHSPFDQPYRNLFEVMFSSYHEIMITKSVQIGDINPNLPTDTIRKKVRDEYLRQSTVTVVLIGAETWKRKHVDWEIGSSIRDTQYNTRSGLIGILLPTYPYPSPNQYSQYTIPPRLSDNINCGFASIYNWDTNANSVQEWIHQAFNRRNEVAPDNSYPSFVNNRSGERWYA